MPTPITARVEVQFIPGGAWTDISLSVRSTTINRPRPGLAGAATTTTCTVLLNNEPDSTGFCPFVPDSPVSVYYPHVEPDRRIRVTALWGASASVRFNGFVDKWEPEMGDSGTAGATCTVTASCVLGRYARRSVLSVYGETVTSLVSPGKDYWPFDDPDDSQTLRGLCSAGFTPRDGLIVPPSKSPGSATLQVPDGGYLADGHIEFTRGDTISACAPVALLRLRGTDVRSVSASFRLSADPAQVSDDALAAYDAAGDLLWRWSPVLSAGLISWTLFDNAGNAKSTFDTEAPRDDAWHYWHLQFSATPQSSIFLYDKGGHTEARGSTAWSYDPREAAWLVVGGQMSPYRKGKQSNTFQGSISSLLVQYDSDPSFTYDEFMVPGLAADASRTHLFLQDQGDDIDTLVGGHFTPGTGSDLRQVMYTNNTSNLLDRWNEHTITVSGQIFTRPSGLRQFKTSETARPTTVSVTLDVAEDLHMPAGGWAQMKEERPTRVKATGPAGSVEVVDEAAETLTGQRLEGPSLSTSAGSVSLLGSAAAAAFGPKGVRLAQFGMDLTLTQTDKTAALMALIPHDRVRVSGLPTAYMGLSYVDCYVSGWSEMYTGNGKRAEWVFDTDPADDPPEAVLDNAEYGRVAIGDGVATVTGGTCVGTTGTGTIIITSSSPLSTAAGDWTCDLDWAGERITCTVPGGATSPQTLTVTARGVAPTVARVHPAGHPIEVWHAATLAP